MSIGKMMINQKSHMFFLSYSWTNYDKPQTKPTRELGCSQVNPPSAQWWHPDLVKQGAGWSKGTELTTVGIEPSWLELIHHLRMFWIPWLHGSYPSWLEFIPQCFGGPPSRAIPIWFRGNWVWRYPIFRQPQMEEDQAQGNKIISNMVIPTIITDHYDCGMPYLLQK